MATATRPHPPKTDDGRTPYKVTVRQFEKMIAAGVFPGGVSVELLDGLIAAKTTHPTAFLGHTPLYPISIRQYKMMIAAGVFPDRAKVELLGGVLAAQMTKYAPHNFTVRRLGGLFRALVVPDWVVSEEKPVEFGRNWRPEPDLAVAVGPEDRYRANDPAAKDLVLLIEVSESSYTADRDAKWHGYAAAKLPVYWIVNLGRRTVEVYTNPAGRGKSARYRDAQTYAETDSVPVVIGGQELGSIAVKGMLP